jgi:2-amino-4-hydroxy-6-hydroxymethyldihydropteridine diphosphokinase
MAIVYIGLGSNVGNREEYLHRAVSEIINRSGAELIAESSILETKAVDFMNQPDFLNMIIKINTAVEPLRLLEMLLEIEKNLGRIRRFPKGPREIDLDILLYDNMIMNEPSLKIPHPEILNRDFIQYHLLELDSDLIEPLSQKKYSEVFSHDSYKKHQ